MNRVIAAGEAPAAEASATDPGVIEQRALRLGVWASLAIAIAGVAAYALSGADALLLIGMLSVAVVAALGGLATWFAGAAAAGPGRRGPHHLSGGLARSSPAGGWRLNGRAAPAA